MEESDLKGAKLLGEDLSLLQRILQSIKSPNFPNEVKENLKKHIQNNDDAALDRLYTVMSAAENEQMSSVISGLVEDLINRKRDVNLKKEVYGGIVGDESTSELLQKIADFEGKDVEDLQLAAELRSAVFAKIKRDLVENASKNLGSEKAEVDALLEDVAPLLKSNLEDQRLLGVELVKLAYRAEIAAFKKKIQDMITKDVDPEMVRIYIDGLPLRPSVAGIDYVETVLETREKAFESINFILERRKIETATKIREDFPKQDVDTILSRIDEFPSDSDQDRATKVQLLELYKSFVAADKPEIFDEQFAEEINRREEEQLRAKFISPEKGKNKEAFNFVRSRFVDTIYPLVESLRADNTTAPKVNSFLEKDLRNPNKPNPRRQFEQRMKILEDQRPLTDTERSYLKSVELMSVFNPYLVASAYADPGATREFLRHHFERLSRETVSEIKDGDYFPLLQIGLGPNGLAAIGEVVRNNPDLASSMLVVDAGEQPGGPFAIPDGAAWELNSANRRGSGGRTMPKDPRGEELKTVRSYGSPLRWYPGERGEDKTIRQGSINATVDYLVAPDDLSTARYPTNEELQIVLSMQAAILTNKVALETKVVDIESNRNPDKKGDKLVTLEIKDSNGARRVRVATDAIFGSTGLGEAGYGFKLEGSRAEKVINETKGNGFPKITKTLDAFNALAGRSREQISPGETMVIWGKGNSADTLIEYIGNIFQGDNPLVRDVTKVYIISNGDLSSRPRYALINDLKPRNGRGNLIEQVPGRVGDVDFENNEGDPSERKLVFYDEKGQIIKNSSGEVITADSAIAATGFKSKLDNLLENYTEEGGEKDEDKMRSPLVLPTNENVTIAETLSNDPTVLILGTASSPEFDSVDKLAQLPFEAREALLRNGAENAVAIGFRAPDTQAAVNVWLNSQEVEVEKSVATAKREIINAYSGESIDSKETFWIDTVVDPEKVVIPNNVQDEARVLSSLFTYNIGNSIEVIGPDGKRLTGEVSFTMTYDPENKQMGLVLGADTSAISKELMDAVKESCVDKDFQKYALTVLRKKRRNPRMDIVLSFKNGFVDPKKTFVQD